MTVHPLRNPGYLFAGSASAVLIACIAVARALPSTAAPDVAAWGIAFDLTITIPLLYYFFIVRSGRATTLSMVAVFMACVAIAKIVAPASPFLREMELVAAPLELAVVALIARRIWKRQPLLPGRLGAFLAAELNVMTYAIFGWRMRRDVPEDARAFSIHERSGWGSIAACIIVLIAAESIGVHLLLMRWSVKAAWIITALDVWGMLWVMGDYHALRLRPVLATKDGLDVRVGMRWRIVVPWEDIAAIEPIAPASSWKRPGVLKAALVDEPRIMIRLGRTLRAHGIAGFEKFVDSIAILPDDEESFSALLRAHASTARSAAHR